MRQRMFGFILIGVAIALILVFAYFMLRSNGKVGTDAKPFPTLPFGIGSGKNKEDNTVVTPITDDVTPTTDASKDGDDHTPLRLVKISQRPVTGYAIRETYKDILNTVITPIDVKDPVTGEIIHEDVAKDIITRIKVPIVRYDDRANGNLYETEVYPPLKESKLTSTNIIGTGEIIIAPSTVWYRYYSESANRIETLRGDLFSTVSAVTCPYNFSERLTLNMTGRAVEQVQSFAQEALGISQSLIQPGIFDTATQQLVKDFQKAYKLQPDGIVGKNMNKILNELCIQKEQQEQEKKIKESGDIRYRLTTELSPRLVYGMATSPDKRYVFSLVDADTTVSGIVSAIGSAGTKQIYSLPFSDWNVTWPTAINVLLVTKASGLVPGSVYWIDVTLQQPKLEKIWGDRYGLTARMSIDGSKMLYSISQDGAIEFGVFDMKTRRAKALPFVTLPEKCVWAYDSVHAYCGVPDTIPGGLYPDLWYQHAVSFNDDLWKINVLTGETNLLDTLDGISPTADIVSLEVAYDESYLFFKDSASGYIWSYRLIDATY